MRPYDDEQSLLMQISGPYGLLNVVKYLAENLSEMPTAREFQLLQVPENWSEISDAIDAARNPESPDIKEFLQLSARADKMIADGFGLSNKELDYIVGRLSTPPFDVLQPRWPWKGAARRTIKGYSADRFA